MKTRPGGDRALRGIGPFEPALLDVAVLIAGGGEAIADIDVLRHQSEVLGSFASAPTVWRTLDEVTPRGRKAHRPGRAQVRAHVWSQLESREHPGILALMLRAGNAGSNTAADHITVLSAALG